jgi:transcriptional regulator with XRE-family HTH domain
MKHGIQKKIAEKAGYTEQYVSFILNKKRNNISTECAQKLADVSIGMGLPFTPDDWMFRANEIKRYIRNLDSNYIEPPKQLHSQKNEEICGGVDES